MQRQWRDGLITAVGVKLRIPLAATGDFRFSYLEENVVGLYKVESAHRGHITDPHLPPLTTPLNGG